MRLHDVRMRLASYLRRRDSVPVWIGGLFPGTRVLLLEVGDPPGKPVLDTRANDDGIVDDWIDKRLGGATLRLALRSTWFKNMDMNVVVEDHGITRAIRMHRDYTYGPGQSGSEQVPADVARWEPEISHQCAARQAESRTRAHVKLIPPLIWAVAAVAIAAALRLGLGLEVWASIAVTTLLAGLGAVLRPYLDGRKKWPRRAP